MMGVGVSKIHWRAVVSKRWRTLLVVLAVCSLTVVSLYCVAQRALVAQSATVERQGVSRDLEAVSSALSQEVLQVQNAAVGWAHWHDEYLASHSGTTDLADLSPDAPALVSMGVDFVIYVDSAGQMTFSRYVDAATGTDSELPAGLGQSISVEMFPAPLDNGGGSLAGIVLLEDRVVMAAAQPIPSSPSQGPAIGALVMGCDFELEETARLSMRPEMSVGLRRADQSGMTPEFEQAISALSKDQPTVVQVLDGERIGAYRMVDDIHANPAIVLGVSVPRDSYAQAQQTSRYVLYVLVGLGALVAVMVIVGIESRAKARMGHPESAAPQTASAGVDDGPNTIADVIDGGSVSLAHAQLEPARNDALSKAATCAVSDIVLRIDREGAILEVSRPRRAAAPTDDPTRALTYKVVDQVTAQIRRLAMPQITKAIESGETQVIGIHLSLETRTSDWEAVVVSEGHDSALVLVRDVTLRKTRYDSPEILAALRQIHQRVQEFNGNPQPSEAPSQRGTGGGVALEKTSDSQAGSEPQADCSPEAARFPRGDDSKTEAAGTGPRGN